MPAMVPESAPAPASAAARAEGFRPPAERFTAQSTVHVVDVRRKFDEFDQMKSEISRSEDDPNKSEFGLIFYFVPRNQINCFSNINLLKVDAYPLPQGRKCTMTAVKVDILSASGTFISGAKNGDRLSTPNDRGIDCLGAFVALSASQLEGMDEMKVHVVIEFTEYAFESFCHFPTLQRGDLSCLLETEDYSDVTFVLGEEKIKAHKSVLASRSTHFYKLFLTEEKTEEKIEEKIEEKGEEEGEEKSEEESNEKSVEKSNEGSQEKSEEKIDEKKENKVVIDDFFELFQIGWKSKENIEENIEEKIKEKRPDMVIADDFPTEAFKEHVLAGRSPYLPQSEAEYEERSEEKSEENSKEKAEEIGEEIGEDKNEEKGEEKSEENGGESSSNEVVVDDFPALAFKVLLRYLYSGKKPAYSRDYTPDLLSIAHHYGEGELKEMCESDLNLHLSVDNVAEALLLADRLDCPNILHNATTIFKRNVGDLIQRDDWNKLTDNHNLVVKLIESFDEGRK